MENKRVKFAVEIVGKYIKDFYLEHARLAAESGEEFLEYGTLKEKYLKEIFRLYMVINESIDRIKFTGTFLSIENVPEYYVENGIQEIEYYRHHIEFFHIKCISIFDYCVNLVNHSVRLGIPVQKCNVYNIIENTLLKGQPIVKRLKKFNEEIKGIKKDRNIIIHQGDFESITLNNIDSNIISNDFFDHGKEITERFNIRKKQKIEETIKILKRDIDKIKYHIGEIYECLIPLIEKNIKFLELEE